MVLLLDAIMIPYLFMWRRSSWFLAIIWKQMNINEQHFIYLYIFQMVTFKPCLKKKNHNATDGTGELLLEQAGRLLMPSLGARWHPVAEKSIEEKKKMEQYKYMRKKNTRPKYEHKI